MSSNKSYSSDIQLDSEVWFLHVVCSQALFTEVFWLHDFVTNGK